MGEKWRLIPFSSNDAALNMAIDESILRLKSEGKVPNTIRLYSWKPSAVSIGFFQSIEDEVNLMRCKKLEIDIVRRITGGGAVYHDQNGEVTYSIIIDSKDSIISPSILDSYEFLCQGVVKGLYELGLDAKFQKINDVIVNNKKISGNAQTRKWNVLLQHGTILVNVDVNKMFSVLRVNDEKIRDKIISAVQERVTSVNNELDKQTSLDEVAECLRVGFERILNVSFVNEGLTTEEVNLAKELKNQKYSSKKWSFSR